MPGSNEEDFFPLSETQLSAASEVLKKVVEAHTRNCFVCDVRPPFDWVTRRTGKRHHIDEVVKRGEWTPSFLKKLLSGADNAFVPVCLDCYEARKKKLERLVEIADAHRRRR